MHAVDMDVLRDEDIGDCWYVTNGVVAVGPVSFDLLTRGVAQGRIPAGSYVRHESWKVWRGLEDIEALGAAGRSEAVAHLGDISSSAEERASSPHNEAPPPPTREELDQPTSDRAPPPSVRPPAVDPVGVLQSAIDISDALLLALSTAVTASAAHVGLVHRVRYDLDATVTACGHGPGAELLLGERLSPDDPALLAAQSGHTVMGEPRLGEAARYIAGRVARCIPGPRGVAMVPLMLHGRLAAMFEVGRRWRPFRAREVARVEDVVEAAAERALVMGWLD
jgi:GYF domain 2